MSTPEWTQNKTAFERYFREAFLRENIGDYADDYQEQDIVCELCEDGWPDWDKWAIIYNRLAEGGELTPREREQAAAYWQAGEDYPPKDMQLL